MISLAPKWTIAKLSGLLNGFTRIARMIPNAPSIAGHGSNPIAYSPSLTAQDRSALAELFAGLGELPEVEEGKLESYALLTAMGPTYLWPRNMRASSGEFIDVWEKPAEADRHGIQTIPTRVLVVASGKGLSRHAVFSRRKRS